jgi:N4-(beta-N-acetylglucosaminyl)-L-asparaginase
MTETDHVMLVGDGALKFAKEMGFPEEDLLVDDSRKAWVAWKKSLRDKAGHNNWTNEVDAGTRNAQLRQMFPDENEEKLAWIADVIAHPPTGTINCLSLNAKGEMSGVTTTSGLAWKIAGRIGDSPIIGAGLYVDQEVGGAGSTGRGEENIRIAGAHTIVENMRRGMTPKEACLDALKRIARNFNNDKSRLNLFDINFYALRKDGMYAGTSLWDKRDKSATSGFKFAVNDGGESRLEDCVPLNERT